MTREFMAVWKVVICVFVMQEKFSKLSNRQNRTSKLLPPVLIPHDWHCRTIQTFNDPCMVRAVDLLPD